MKVNMFKIRKPMNGADSHIKQNSKSKNQLENKQILTPTPVQMCQQNMNKLMSMFETFMKHSLDNTPKENNKYSSQTFQKSELQYEPRDRHIIFNIPQYSGSQLSQTDIEGWVTQVCMAAFSSSFNYYVTEQMTFEQSKIFCSETILKNLLKFTQKYKLEAHHMQIIDDHLRNNILQYLQRKYPLTQSSDVNKALQKELQQTNNMDLIENDFLYSNGITFKYRKDGNYNDIVMRVLNKTMEVCQELAPHPLGTSHISNYQDYEIYMGELFEKVFSQQFVHGYHFAIKNSMLKQNTSLKLKEEEHKQKYKEKTKEYTHYVIGRKISENTPQFSEQQIQGQNLTVQNPAILRILTKWCEQLWTKFESQNYLTERAQPVVLQDPQFINPFFKWMKTSIDKRLQVQKTKILDFKKKLDEHCQFQEAVTFLKYLQEDDVNFIPKYEKACGKFAAHMVRNLHSYIIIYLNRLLHGLLTVSKEFFDKQVDKSWQDWPAPPNLITFKIGDLIRCKCSSKQKQIIALFKDIIHISNSNPQKMKIVRIKNRLREGTNDILINVRFNNKIISEIQLEVISKSKTKFIQCSNSFSHYIYELKRSIFGPLSEMCNIWNNFEPRAKTFHKLITVKSLQFDLTQKIEPPSCSKDGQHQFENCLLPFECTQCNSIYFHNNYIFSNKKCINCLIYVCVRCQIKKLSCSELKESIFKTSKHKKDITNACSKLGNNTIPNYGVCVKLQSKEIKLELFKFMKVESKYWLFGINEDESIYEIQKVRSIKEREQFIRQYCVFQIQSGGSFIKIPDKKALNFAVRQYLKDSYKEQKEALILTQIRFTAKQMEELIKNDGGTEAERKRIKKIQYASNYIDDISYFSVFEGVTDLNIDYNKFSSTKPLLMFKNLQKLNMRDNRQLFEIGDEIGQLQKLQYIKIRATSVKTISPSIGNLKNLISLQIDNNALAQLPDSICNLINLRDLNFSSNRLEKLPDDIENLINLKKLQMNKNKLKQIPDDIIKLQNLTILSIANNQLTSIPQKLNNLKKLQKIELNNNQITQLAGDTFRIDSLKHIAVHYNKLKLFLMNLEHCKQLEYLSIHCNQITQLTQTIQYCTNLTTFELHTNALSQLPTCLSKLKKLKPVFNIKSNSITAIPQEIFSMNWITQINAESNSIQQIPSQIDGLKMLESVNFMKNKIKDLPKEFKQLKYVEKQINLKMNQLESIPDYFSEFKSIKKKTNAFDGIFRGNPIKDLSPKIIEAMKDEIVLTNCHLSVLPLTTIVNKDSIKTINLSSNQICEIPREIGQFVELTKFDISNNKIEVIPKELSLCQKIFRYSLAFNNNPIKNIECLEFAQARANFASKTAIKNYEKSIEQEKKKTQKTQINENDDSH